MTRQAPPISVWWSRLYALVALDVVVAGSLVNSQMAALSVPDWPLSYGRPLLLRWPGNTFYEQHHRVLVALMLVVAVGTWVAAVRKKAPVRPLAARLLQLLVAQILLGGLVVLSLDPPAVAAVHVVLAQLVGAGAVLLWLRRELGAASRRHLASLELRSVRSLPWLLVIQVVLGALSWHPPVGRAAGIVTLLAHVLLGPTVVGVALTAAVLLWRRRARLPAAATATVALAQLAAGVAVFIVAPDASHRTWPPPESFPTWHGAHHLFAALLFGVAVFLRYPQHRYEAQDPDSSVSR